MTFIHSRAREFANQLKAQIEHGHKPGDLLLPTAMLSKEHGVTLWTVRGALHLLSREGVIASYSNKGYYVMARDGKPLNPPVPLQRQIADDLRQKILNEDYEPQEKLPSLRELARTYRCSTAPVRGAFEILQDEKLLITVPQDGTYVNTSPDSSHEEGRS